MPTVMKSKNRAPALISLLVMAFLVGPVLPAQADDNPYGWVGCTQRSKALSAPIRVGVVPGSFPAAGQGDGVTNSFLDRIADSTVTMSNQVTNPSGGAMPNGMTYVGGASANITFRYRDLSADGPGTLGVTRVNPSSCFVVHASKVNYASNIYIDIAVRNDWFTQDNSRRSLWESCPSSNYQPAYTCGKPVDAGSTIVHEIGHALGLAHPRSVDSHIGSGSQALILAKCFVINDQATMCQAGDASGDGAYRSHRRTPESYDITSLNRAFN